MISKLRNLLLPVLGACLLVSAWTIYRLASYHEGNTETVVFIDAPSAELAHQVLGCGVGGRASNLDFTDYSFNVTESLQPAGLYRYKTNLDALPPVDVHVLVIRGGSGRVVLGRSYDPVWLVLLSTQAAIWHVELTPGAGVERVITNDSVSEIRFSGSLGGSAASLMDLLSATESAPVETPPVDVLPSSRCFVQLTRFQEYDDLRRFAPAIQSLRSIVGHPEMSLQAAGEPSYFDRPLHVPFEDPERSIERLAEVQRLAAPPQAVRAAPERATNARAARASEFERYANMPRDPTVMPKMASTPAEFLSLLEEYQRRGLLPSSLPTSARGSQALNVADWYSLADYRRAYRLQVPAGVTEDACSGGRDRRLLIIDGTNETNIVKCAWGNQMYFMRGGDDEVDDSWQDDIINAGPGDDLIDAGWGNDVIFFNYGWGQDTVEKTCHDAAYVPQDSARSSQIRWSRDWPYKNFLVFGKDIRRDDIVVVRDKLVHRETGDSIAIDGNCFNLVFW